MLLRVSRWSLQITLAQDVHVTCDSAAEGGDGELCRLMVLIQIDDVSPRPRLSYIVLFCNISSMPASTKSRRTFTISFPADLASQVEQLAQQESRTTSELFREAFRSYRAQQLRKALMEFNELGRRDNHKGYVPEDVEQLVHEIRAERAAKKSFRRK
jgi:predicted transcriptional regulator